MGQTYKADFNVDNGTDYDKYNFSTSADQVEYQKNGKATNVQTELDAINTGITDTSTAGIAISRAGRVVNINVSKSVTLAAGWNVLLTGAPKPHGEVTVFGVFHDENSTTTGSLQLTNGGNLRAEIPGQTSSKTVTIRGQVAYIAAE